MGYPDSFSIAPRFFIRNGEILGRTLYHGDDSHGGLAITPREGWTSCLSVAPLLPHNLLRNLARMAGCHVYTDFPGQVFHCQNYFGMYFHADGECRISLPHRANITDVIHRSRLSCDAQDLSLAARSNSTILLRLDRV
jgi:hypothetical protein